MRRLSAAIAVLPVLAGCAHPEDRRWMKSSVGLERTGEIPSVSVYAFVPPKAGSRTGLRDLSDHGQAALIEAIAKDAEQAAALRKALATPLEGESASGAVDRSKFSRAIVISVRKGPESRPGDRLMRTVITVKPHSGPDSQPFEFASYTVVATDTKIQNIAKIESNTSASLSAGIAPVIGGFGDNSLGGELSQSHKSSADISQQYENLGIDITPAELTITRESERGLDVVGNTLVALMVAAPFASEDVHAAYLAVSAKLAEKGKVLDADHASLEIKPLSFLARCDLRADVTLNYQLRRIVKGREYYSEGKQEVEVVDGGNRPPVTQILVRAADALGPMYQIVAERHGGAVLASNSLGDVNRLVFDSFDDANRMARWLTEHHRQRVGVDGPLLWIEEGHHLPVGEQYRADFYTVGCANPDVVEGAK